MRVRSALLLSLFVATPVCALDGCVLDVDLAQRSLEALRAQARTCGARPWPAAQPLRWQAALGESARRYAVELAALDRLDHVGAQGATLRTRLREVGYVMRVSGENLAGGPETLDEALAQWLASPVHCENLMAADFEEFGLACVAGPGRLQRYWVLQLAAPAGPRIRSSPDQSP